jgi:hypothetical protein
MGLRHRNEPECMVNLVLDGHPAQEPQLTRAAQSFTDPSSHPTPQGLNGGHRCRAISSAHGELPAVHGHPGTEFGGGGGSRVWAAQGWLSTLPGRPVLMEPRETSVGRLNDHVSGGLGALRSGLDALDLVNGVMDDFTIGR